MISYSLPGRQPRLSGPTTPYAQRLTAVTRMRFGLFRFRSPLLTESRLLSLPVGTEMFHFPTFPPHALCVQAWVTGHDSSRVSPFGYPRITAWLPTPRGLSQAPTSFIGSWCQGIHRAPLLTWPQRCLFRVHCAVLKLRAVAVSFDRRVRQAAWLRDVVRRGGSRAEADSQVRSLRTQQRAEGAAGAPEPFRAARRPYLAEVARADARLVNVPPMSSV